MTLWPSWIAAYGWPGEPGPVRRCSLLVGGPYNGERRNMPGDWHIVKMPVPRKVSYYSYEDPPPLATFKEVLYEWRTLRPCWSAAPFRVLVAQGTPDKTALALYQEWQ